MILWKYDAFPPEGPDECHHDVSLLHIGEKNNIIIIFVEEE